MIRLPILLILFSLSQLVKGQNNLQLLEQVSKNIEDNKSLSYELIRYSIHPYSSVLSKSVEIHVTRFSKRLPEINGSTVIVAPISNPSKPDFIYDDELEMRIDRIKKEFELDTITSSKQKPTLEFFSKCSSLINYILNNPENVEIKTEKFQDSIKFDFQIRDQIVTFLVLPPHVVPSPGKNSRYLLTVDKNLNFPTRLNSKLPHQHIQENISNLTLMDTFNDDLQVPDFIPKGFSLKNIEKKSYPVMKLEGSKIQNWKLSEIAGAKYSLDQLDNKIILIQFTGIGCSPCHDSIPFLKKLSSDYEQNNLQIVSLETWSNNQEVIEIYKKKNELNYELFLSNEEVNTEFRMNGGPVPTFILIDRNKVIKKVFVGYKKDVTDKEIITHIEEIINDTEYNKR